MSVNLPSEEQASPRYAGLTLNNEHSDPSIPNMSRKLEHFASNLKSVIGESGNRPFVCDGSPIDCQAFIVGINPATSMATSFWHYWDNQLGFNKSAWFKDYLLERQNTNKAISPTRRIINLITDTASPVKTLETNIYSAPARRAKDLAKPEKEIAAFKFLLREIRPSVVLLHGLETRNVASCLFETELIKDRITIANWEGVTFKVIPVNHFAYQWSYAKAKAIGMLLHDLIKENNESIPFSLRKICP